MLNLQANLFTVSTRPEQNSGRDFVCCGDLIHRTSFSLSQFNPVSEDQQSSAAWSNVGNSEFFLESHSSKKGWNADLTGGSQRLVNSISIEMPRLKPEHSQDLFITEAMTLPDDPWNTQYV